MNDQTHHQVSPPGLGFRIALGTTVSLCLVVMAGLEDGTGFGKSCGPAGCQWWAAASPVALLVAGLLCVLWVFPNRNVIVNDQPLNAGLFRRLFAFCIDFSLVLAAIAPVIGLVMLLREAALVHDFEWSYGRDFARNGESMLGFIAAFVILGSLYAYFSSHLRRGQATVGQYVMGYSIVWLDEPRPEFLVSRRIVAAVFGLFLIHRIFRHGGNVFPWDITSRSEARLFPPA